VRSPRIKYEEPELSPTKLQSVHVFAKSPSSINGSINGSIKSHSSEDSEEDFNNLNNLVALHSDGTTPTIAELMDIMANGSSKVSNASAQLSFSAMTFNPYLESSIDKSLFQHYTTVVARTLSRSNDDTVNPFLKVLLPVAGSSPTVMDALLGLSGSHWKRIHPGAFERGLTRQSKGSSLSSYI
jgi:Fungal specific transcription factor domain